MAWTKAVTADELEFIRSSYGRMTVAAIAERLGRSERSVYRHIAALGLRGEADPRAHVCQPEREPEAQAPPACDAHGKIAAAAKSGNERELYQGLLEDLVATLEGGCEAYTKPGIVKQILAIQEKLNETSQSDPDSPMSRRRARTDA